MCRVIRSSSGSWHRAQNKGSSSNRQEETDVSDYQGRLSGPRSWLDIFRESPRKGIGNRSFQSEWEHETRRESGQRSDLGLNVMNVEDVMMHFSLHYGSIPCSLKEKWKLT